MTIRIVVVDDDDTDRYIAKRIIGSLGIDAEITEYCDGKPFVEVIRDKNRTTKELGETPPPIFVLLDINMPRMGGFEVLNALKEDLSDDGQVVFVTMYSSSNHAQDRSDASEFPFVKDYIVKPPTVDKMNEILHALYPNELKQAMP